MSNNTELREQIDDILFEWENDIASGAGHNHRSSIRDELITLISTATLDEAVFALKQCNQGLFVSEYVAVINNLRGKDEPEYDEPCPDCGAVFPKGYLKEHQCDE